MEYLYAPWRSDYIAGEKKEECVFCAIARDTQSDRKNHVLFRTSTLFGVMNRYPYTPGHFMIIPLEHCADLEALAPQTWLEMATLAQEGVRLLKEGFKAHGVNLGMNLGKAGGAGIAEHLHLHLVPRFERDTNFVTTIAQTRVYSTNFEEIYEKIASLWSDTLTRRDDGKCAMPY